ncbi:MAG: hypothetical protein RL028_504, partial [Actinomycetota bacterium]
FGAKQVAGKRKESLGGRLLHNKPPILLFLAQYVDYKDKG